jgi:RNA exonuclease 4
MAGNGSSAAAGTIAALDNVEHDAVSDAIKSIRLFNHYHRLRATPGAWEAAQAALLAAPPTLSFARRFPVYEGVCMGNRKSCSCGAPFFS